MNYQIVLFKNKERQRIINKFLTLTKAKEKYDLLIKKSSEVIFEKGTENGKECLFELGLLELGKKTDNQVYIKDKLGRNMKVELDDDNFNMLKIKEYKIEETFLDYKTKKKINTSELINKYLKGAGLKQVSKLNNKIIVQNDEKINLFTLKSEDDALRFTERLQQVLSQQNKKDCIIVTDYSTIHRKYLYKILTEQGFPIKYLQRYSTTHLSKR
jgi:hypothetical protein